MLSRPVEAVHDRVAISIVAIVPSLKCQGLHPRQQTLQHKHISFAVLMVPFSSFSSAFHMQEWFHLARNDVLRLRRTPLLVRFLVGWFKFHKVKERTKIESVWEHGAEENVRTHAWSDRRPCKVWMIKSRRVRWKWLRIAYVGGEKCL
jgi:hypothetical protein